MSQDLLLSLYHNDMSVCAQKVRLVLEHKQLRWESHHLNLREGEQFKPEFREISPKSVVPVLVHDGHVINESSTIIEYVQEVYPEHSLMPDDAFGRALVRNWIVRFDAGLHEQVAVISFCIAFRHQLLAKYKTDAELREFLKNIPDPTRAAVLSDVVLNGMNSSRLRIAAFAYDQLLADMVRALAKNKYLVGDKPSLADYTVLPYIDRLDQLQLSTWWDSKLEVSNWLAALRESDAYSAGIEEWKNQAYIELMRAKSGDAWPQLATLIKK